MPFMKELFIVELDYLPDSSEYFERFSAEPWASFLDSCASSYEDEAHSRYDIVTANPWAVVNVTADGITEVHNRLEGTCTRGDQRSPFAVLSELVSQMTPVDSPELPFTGGALGFWGYELISVLEPEKVQSRPIDSPLMTVGLYHWALITDHQNQTTKVVFHPDTPVTTRDSVLRNLDMTSRHSDRPFTLKSEFKPSITREAYYKAFENIQDYILAGDCYEVNLTQEFTSDYEGCSWSAYKHLRKVSPAPYSAYLNHPDMEILSHSPERFIKVTERQVETHPIKGTRPRGSNAAEDRAHAEELLNSEKDRSENLMIVDLLRNDLGKVCKTGSIEVPRLFDLESYANVHHLVSTITGELEDDCTVFDLMESAFPGGSITGAPKIRSMEIIRELEASARNAYCGAIGYVSTNGHMDTSITIRTLVASENKLRCWGGGAIVADSDCQQEYQESVTKVKNLMVGLESFYKEG